MASPAQLATMVVDKKILKVTGTVIRAWRWEGEATGAQPKCMAGAIAPFPSHCCILDKLSSMVIMGSHFQLSFVPNEA